MSASLLIASIITYILSLVFSLVLMIFSKKLNSRWKRAFIIFHSILLVAYLFSFFWLKFFSGTFFLIFFCFGVAIAGMILRSHMNLLLKIYYSIFLFSIVVFLYSPSLLFSLLATQKFPTTKGTEFLLVDNYYLVKEKSMLDVSNTFVRYKIIERTGKFNKTLQRNISFTHEIDSIRVLKFTREKEAQLRGYFSDGNNRVDSTDISTGLKIKDENQITIHRE